MRISRRVLINYPDRDTVSHFPVSVGGCWRILGMNGTSGGGGGGGGAGGDPPHRARGGNARAPERGES